MKETGGPAYPTQSLYSDCGQDEIEYQDGMTLRDYFAGQALIGIMTNSQLLRLIIKEQNKDNPDRMERFAFEVADAMIKERNK